VRRDVLRGCCFVGDERRETQGYPGAHVEFEKRLMLCDRSAAFVCFVVVVVAVVSLTPCP
jgi:hypothetical protein